MKKFYILSTLLIAVLSFSSCVNLKKLSTYEPATITLNQVAMSNSHGVVAADVTYFLTDEYYNRHTGVEFRPYILNEETGDRIELNPVVFEGKVHKKFNSRMKELEPAKQDGIHRRVQYVKEGENTYRYVVETPFNEWMEGGCFYVDVIGNAYTSDRYLIKTVPVYCGIFNLASRVVMEPIEHYFYMVKRDCHECLATQIPFKVDSYIIESQFYENAFADNFKSIVFNENVPSYTLKVVIGDSPEGNYAHNQELGENRKQAVINYFESIGIPYDNCEFEINTEDWNVVSEKVAASGLPHAAEICNMIAEGSSDSDKLEQKIRAKYPSEYRTIYEQFYPQCRRAEIDLCPVLTDGNGLMYNYVCDLDECVTVHTLVEKPNEEVFDLNQQMVDKAVAKDYEGAAAIADQIKFKDANIYVNANRALVYFMVGRYNDSKAIYENIAGNIPEADHNLGILCIRNEEYERGAALLKGSADINEAIAKMGVGQYNEAESILVLLPQSAERDDLMAIDNKCKNNQ